MLTFHLEHAHHPQRVCGVDEAGRGPWAGPVVAAAVALEVPPPFGGSLGGGLKQSATVESNIKDESPHQNAQERFDSPSRGELNSAKLTLLNDSKKLSAATREALFDIIHAHASVGIGIASVEEIEELNIWGATRLAMRRAVAALPILPDIALVDGKARPKDFPCPTQMVIGGDGISPSIAAASIIAKVTRDRMMRDLAALYPQYGFERHAGYGTAYHQQALAQHGICPAHRRGFAPIRAIVEA